MWKNRIYTLIDRHKTAFAVSLTVFLIGVFSGIFYILDGEVPTELITAVQPTNTFWRSFFSAVLSSLWLLIVLYISGMVRISVYTVIPVALLVKGYDIGRGLAESADGLWGFMEKVLATLPFSAVLFITAVFGGMVSMSVGYGNDYGGKDSYNKFFIILLVLNLVAVLYYAIIKYIIASI